MDRKRAVELSFVHMKDLHTENTLCKQEVKKLWYCRIIVAAVIIVDLEPLFLLFCP